ncbi:hypothetical protein [Streptomyces sp. NPDC001356]
MLAEARPGLPPERALPGGLAFEQKPDGYRAVLFAGPGRAYLQSRHGADLSSAFPESRQPAGPGPHRWSSTASWSSRQKAASTSARFRREVGGLLYPGGAEYLWQHRRFLAG